ncbi:phospholipid phosphatase-related protein type 5-like [Babylonia areolata]|uniref:phospholipid phosphatase-related protein type 5-like n=1 Tax=Babylonia areolata TaxID=304850 RepID=UPI003FCEF699
MAMSMSTITEDHHRPHPHHHHPRYNPQDSTPFDYPIENPHHLHSAGSGGGGGGVMGLTGGAGVGRPGYAVSEISSSDYASTSTRRGSRQGVLILVTFAIESMLLVLVVIVEYFLRWTDVFPLRRQNFTCTDISISCKSRDKELMADFAFNAEVPEEAVYALSFCVPPLVVLIGEIGLCTYSDGAQKDIRIMDKHCSIPHIARRLLRFLGVFLFGAFSVMIITDVTKNMIGRLRPDFLETCRLKANVCSLLTSWDDSLDESACLNGDTVELRRARTSFPSMNSALTSYAAIYVSVYIHGAMRSHSVRVLRPFLSLVFVLLSVLEGVAQFTTCQSHWTDVLTGLGLGVALALYLTLGVLNQFQEHLSQTEMLQMMRAFLADTYLPYEDKTHLTRPPEQLTALHIPRAHMNPSGAGPPAARASPSLEMAAKQHHHHQQQQQQHQRRRPYNTFQRDLSQSLEYHRRQQSYMQAGTSHM